MIFVAEMTVHLAAGHAGRPRARTCWRARRRIRQELQRDGRWPHLWRVAGRYANVSILDVSSTDELHELLSGLPLFPYSGHPGDRAGAAPRLAID